MNVLKLALSAHTDTCNARYQTFQHNLMEQLSDANQDILPNVDCDGRLHAPVHGYLGGDFTDVVYGKGQYIPMPESDNDDSFFGLPKASKKYEMRLSVHSELLTALREVDELDGISLSVGKSFTKQGKDTSYVYIKACTMGYLNIIKKFITSFDYAKSEEVTKGTAPSGKTEITGTVVGITMQEGFYGSTFKMMVELENNATVYGSIPSKIIDVEKGDKVSFTANFTQANDDTTHAFFKRPSKAKIIERV